MRKTVLTRADTYRHELCEVRIYNTTNDYIKTRQSPSLPEEDVRIRDYGRPKDTRTGGIPKPVPLGIIDGGA